MPGHVETAIPADQLVIRPLGSADSETYRRLRQRILELGDGKYFNSSFETERRLTTDAQWREYCAETPDRCKLGIFVSGALVGSMGVGTHLAGRHRFAVIEAVWLDPQYRKAGIAEQAYKRLRQWCVEHDYFYLISEIRADNTRAREIREKQGAVYLFTRRNLKWADGSTADTVFYLMSFSGSADQSRSLDQAIPFMEAALAFLNQEQLADGRGASE